MTYPWWAQGIVVGAALGAVAPAWSAELTVSAGTEYVSWREYASGQKLLEETGPRFFAAVEGVTGRRETPVDYALRLYGGATDYEGHTWGGSPVTTDVYYRGFAAEAGVSRFNGISGGDRVGVRAALGLDTWQRDITGSGGYMETYTSVYSRLGFPLRLKNWSGEFGLKLPVWTREEVGLGGMKLDVQVDGTWMEATIQGNPVLEPKGAPSFYADLGLWRNRKWEVRFRYDAYRFDTSDEEATTLLLEDGSSAQLYLMQPETQVDTYGLTLRYRL